ncbi:hypothetical protein [Cupriavidus basilensis]|uniref:Uncharacterized protein n=1 Tax=Cupriavidus basilensis TaxID=68895 RepID=A0A0C4Y6F3_9BURK|nr:hypothetical protein [Cupriavidus basilensis]AJG17644.1 hypothetical protein RR42_m0229 [Cupriavidus basilensis]
MPTYLHCAPPLALAAVLGRRPLPLAGAGLFGAARFWLECAWIGLPLLAFAALGAALRRRFDRIGPVDRRVPVRACAD